MRTNEELSNAQDARKGGVTTLVYGRADWAISSVRSLDTFIPSIAFVKALGELNCIIVDISADGGVPVLKRFDVVGVPFLALLDSENKVVTKRLGGITYEGFQEWLTAARNIKAEPDPLK